MQSSLQYFGGKHEEIETIEAFYSKHPNEH